MVGAGPSSVIGDVPFHHAQLRLGDVSSQFCLPVSPDEIYDLDVLFERHVASCLISSTKVLGMIDLTSSVR